jgi:hypothetical protein
VRVREKNTGGGGSAGLGGAAGGEAQQRRHPVGAKQDRYQAFRVTEAPMARNGASVACSGSASPHTCTTACALVYTVWHLVRGVCATVWGRHVTFAPLEGPGGGLAP